jgi:hypothetical protein
MSHKHEMGRSATRQMPLTATQRARKARARAPRPRRQRACPRSPPPVAEGMASPDPQEASNKIAHPACSRQVRDSVKGAKSGPYKGTKRNGQRSVTPGHSTQGAAAVATGRRSPLGRGRTGYTCRRGSRPGPAQTIRGPACRHRHIQRPVKERLRGLQAANRCPAALLRVPKVGGPKPHPTPPTHHHPLYPLRL